MLFLTEDRAFSRTCRLRGRYCQKESRGSYSMTFSPRRWQTKVESVRRLFCDDKPTGDCTPSPFTTVWRTDKKDWRLWLYKNQLIKFDLVRRAASVWLLVRTAVYCYMMFFHLEFHQLQVTSRRSWITLLLIFLVLRFICSRWHFSQRKSCQDHYHNLHLLLDRLHDKSLRCKWEKCCFAQPQVEYFAHMLKKHLQTYRY